MPRLPHFPEQQENPFASVYWGDTLMNGSESFGRDPHSLFAGIFEPHIVKSANPVPVMQIPEKEIPFQLVAGS